MKVDPETGEVRDGRYEWPDPTPVEIPAGFKRPESLSDMIRRLTRVQLSELAASQGDETFEESEDFNIDEDEFPSSPYEEVFDPRLNRGITVEEFHRNYAEYQRRYEKAQDEMTRVAVANEILQRRVRREAKLEDAPSAPPPGGRTGGGGGSDSVDKTPSPPAKE